ncbi:hypothetical protein NQ042_01380 [Corynebacterium phoceense]|uniref:hypothetical protein n=1 Tax=Corynebacterium phoceense TaxID=1686286 RepID=UPI00211C89A8|nr:hypothetical protein [Corynebacterium phoceense]MCQ9332760.1 hypothetical protein [Corynebacterium phoceense]
MPDKAMGWCDCGTHHPATNDLVRPWIQEYFGRLAEQLTHLQIGEILQVRWNFAKVCQFFVDAVNESATRVNGHVDYDYPLATAAKIIGYFSTVVNRPGTVAWSRPVEAASTTCWMKGRGSRRGSPLILPCEHSDYASMDYGRRRRKCFKEHEYDFKKVEDTRPPRPYVLAVLALRVLAVARRRRKGA